MQLLCIILEQVPGGLEEANARREGGLPSLVKKDQGVSTRTRQFVRFSHKAKILAELTPLSRYKPRFKRMVDFHGPRV